MIRTLLGALIALSAVGASTAPGSNWTITTADFNRFAASEIASVDSGVQVSMPSGQRVIAWADFLSADRSGAAPSQPGKFEIMLISNDVVSGEPMSLDGSTLRWKNPVVGEVTFDLTQVICVARAGVRRATEATTSDVVTLSNGDEVQGIISGFVEENFQLQTAAGDVVTVPLSSLASIRFATTGRASNSASGSVFRVALTDGSALTATNLTLTTAEANLKLGGETNARTIPVASIVGFEQLNGPVAWLSALTPELNEHVPYFGRSTPATMDRTVRGEAIRFGDQTYSRGIGVHAKSRLVWPLDGSFKTFRTQFAMDGDLPYANAIVRVKLDDEVVHETSHFTAGVLSPVVSIPLNTAKSITLEVDYGETYDVQDRLNWIEPALIRSEVSPTK